MLKNVVTSLLILFFIYGCATIDPYFAPQNSVEIEITSKDMVKFGGTPFFLDFFCV